ncbi:MAG: hypothetical protein KFW07_03800 [Mycoplasmataceae bacterium]|nr:hypothetical protein [Mycoplasmataceae bacterium]
MWPYLENIHFNFKGISIPFINISLFSKSNNLGLTNSILMKVMIKKKKTSRKIEIQKKNMLSFEINIKTRVANRDVVAIGHIKYAILCDLLIVEKFSLNLFKSKYIF